jgi:hypothetical protein
MKVNNNGYEPNLLVARRTNPDVIVTFQTTVRMTAPFSTAPTQVLISAGPIRGILPERELLAAHAAHVPGSH